VIFNENDGLALRQETSQVVTPIQNRQPVKAYSQQRSDKQDFPTSLKVRSQRFGKLQAETTVELYLYE